MKDFSRLVFGKELISLAESNDFIIFNADTKSCAIEDFGKKYPERNFSFGIAEQNLIASAAGAARCGEKVYLATFATFASMRACEQVRTFVCYPNVDVTILGSHAGLQTGTDGATHISTEDISIMRSFPNMTIVEPSDYVAAKKLARLSLDFHTPLYIRFPKTATPQIHDENTYSMKIGVSNLILNYGNDVAIIAMGWILSWAMEAAEILKGMGINAKVIEMHTVKPLDEEAVIKAAKDTGAVVTIEDHTILGGLGAAVSEVLGENIPTYMQRIGVLDRFGVSGEPKFLYEENNMTVSDIISACKKVIAKKESK